MLNAHLLVILSDFGDADTVMDTVLDAIAHAARPYSLHFAIPSRLWEDFTQIDLPGQVLPRALAYPEETGALAGALAASTDDTHFLALSGPHGFAERWDRELLSRFAKIGERRAILTAMITGEAEDAQCCLPCFVPEFRENSVRIDAGVPLVNAAAPVRTMAVSDGFVMGEMDFLRQATTARSTLSIGTFVAGYAAYALDRPAIWPLDHRRVRRLALPSADELPATALARFEQFAGVSFSQQCVTLRAAKGLFGITDNYPQALLPKELVRQRLTDIRVRDQKPLFLSAFVDLPDCLRNPQDYLIRFSYLKNLQALPLTLYTGGVRERKLRAAFPNTLAYPDRTLLPRSLLAEGMSETQLFQRNKLPLMQRVLHAAPGFSHIAWVDIDILQHPVYPQAIPDFTQMMDDRVHIATVDGEPDLSCIVVPRSLVRLLSQEVQACTQIDAAMKRSFSATRMMIRIMEKLPDVFAVHPMPARELLLLTGFDPALLSVTLQRELAKASPVIRATPKNGKEKQNHGRDSD